MFFGSKGGHAGYEKNLSKTTYADTTHACAYCGRELKGHTHYVFLSTACEPMDPAAVKPGSDFLGYYGVGSACAKVLAKKGVKVYEAGKLPPVNG